MVKVRELGVRGKVRRIFKQMHEFSRSPVLSEGEKSDTFIWNRVKLRVVACPQHCSLFLMIY